MTGLRVPAGNSAAIRTALFDYRKAFDLINHSILIRKFCMLDVPIV